MTTRRNTNKAESESTRVTVISGVDQRGALHSTCKSEKVTEGIMTSLRYLTCLFLLTVSLTDLSKAGCRDQFTKNAWKNLTNRLPDYIPIQMDRKPEEVMECSIKNTDAEPTLEDCFEDTDVCKGKSNSSTSVAFYHLMCLTDIAMNLTENEESKTIAAGVCKVYEKVCEPFLQSSSTPAPKMTTSSTAATTTTSPATSTTATAPPSSPKMTTPTSSKATATTASPETATTTTAPLSSPKMTTPTSSKATATTASPETATTATAPPSSPKMTTPTSSKATATTASPETSTTATAPLSSPKMTTPTSSKATATTASPETATSTSSTATTVSLATPTTESKPAPSSLSAPGKSDKNIGACATNETDIFKLQIVIAFLIFTNVLGPLAVYMYMRRQRNRESFNDVNRNMPDTVQMTIQPQTLDQIEDSGEGAVLLKTSQCSVIINPPETTQTEKRQNGLGH
ncbi:cell wall protein DAN4-like isoform X2 [Archocentrus centrarchus]|uniref:cell wall protein DAN4-like isoform X2 n=1 Tax=Archocentrus centrarchus TaxID=63155 RepID=UPI0011EA104B|nr:cell wall protein DAN4-like isoform X2 [Archocentrus centrarchus]